MLKKSNFLFLFAIGIAILATYFSSFENAFTYLDDQVQVVNNSTIKQLSAENVKAIFSSTSVGMYQPMTTLIYAVIYQLNGLSPFAFHFASALFHFLNTLILFLLLKELKFTHWLLYLMCTIFAMHPMQVESVAWVSAFSNLVFTSFYLSSLLLYLHFINGKKKLHYWLSCFLFLLSCFSKATAISLPLILIAIDFYQHKNLKWKNLVNKLPFLLVSITFGLIAINSREAAGHLSDLSLNFGLIDRVFLISYSLLFYPIKFLWGFNLSAFYPYPELSNGFLPWAYYAAFLVLLGCVGLLYKFRNQKELLIAALLYLLMIAPTLHFVPVGNQLTTDRYIYLPMLGLLLFLGFLFKNLPMNYFKYATIFLAVGLGLMSFERSKVWQNDKQLWTDVIAKHPNVAQAYNNLGSYVLLEGKKQEAFQNFDKAIQLKPYYADAYNNRGNLYSQAGKSEKAMADFNKAIELRPHADAYFNRGNELSKSGNFQMAIDDYSQSLSLKKSSDTYTNRAFAKMNLNADAEAVNDLKSALKLDPTYHQAYFLLAMEARKRVDFDAACRYLQKAAQYGNQKAAAGFRELCQNN